MRDKTYIGRIVIDPKVRFGRPFIAGTDITVDEVLELIHGRLSFKEILTKYYPNLEEEDLKACIRYATRLERSQGIHLGPP